MVFFNMTDVTSLQAVDNLTQNSFSASFSQPQMNFRQIRSFGPLFSIFLSNFLANLVTAKYDPYLSLDFAYDTSPWLAYNKPKPYYDIHHHYEQHPDNHYYYNHPEHEWYPVQNPPNDKDYVHPSDDKLTTLTTSQSYTDSYMLDLQPPPLLQPSLSSVTFNQYQDHIASASNVVTTVATPDLQQAESNINQRRRPNKNKGSYRRKYSNRRRTTTPQYYDSYEDITERPHKYKRRPDMESVEIYDDSDYDADYTTKYYKRKRPTTKSRIKNRKTQPTTENFLYEDNFSIEGPQTEIVFVRQRQQSTTTQEPTTFITNGTTTTEGSTSTTTESTTSMTTTITNNNTFHGYGPSNGNEGISITYGPPYQHAAPYIDWYTQGATRDGIVKRVQDIVGFDRDFFQRKLHN